MPGLFHPASDPESLPPSAPLDEPLDPLEAPPLDEEGPPLDALTDGGVPELPSSPDPLPGSVPKVDEPGAPKSSDSSAPPHADARAIKPAVKAAERTNRGFITPEL
jgi:hypothetical protein